MTSVYLCCAALKCYHGLKLNIHCKKGKYFWHLKIRNQVKALSWLPSWASLLERSQVETHLYLSPTTAGSAFWSKQKSLCLLLVFKLNVSRPFEDTSYDKIARPLTIPTDCSGSCLICQCLSLNVTARNGHDATDVVNQSRLLLIFVTYGHYTITGI